LKTVWNNQEDPEHPNTLQFNEGDVQAICVAALAHAIRANSGTRAILNGIKAGDAQSETSTVGGKKGKGKAKPKPKPTASIKDLKPLAGLNNGFITLVKKTGQKMCIGASTKSCFPKSLNPVGGKEGDLCDGDVQGSAD
jgi:hypothetical protein